MRRKNLNLTVEPAASVKAAPPQPVQLPDQETFLECLMKNLCLAKQKYPAQYAWKNADLMTVFRALVESLKAGTYSRHSHAIQWACRDLNIPCEFETIDSIFESED